MGAWCVQPAAAGWRVKCRFATRSHFPEQAAIYVAIPHRTDAQMVFACALVGAHVHCAPAAVQTVQLSLDKGHGGAAGFAGGDIGAGAWIGAGIASGQCATSYALLILSAAETQLGNPAAGRKAGKAAWRAARATPAGMRYDIARHTALAALRQGKSLPAQFWLRRALDLRANRRRSRPNRCRFPRLDSSRTCRIPLICR